MIHDAILTYVQAALQAALIDHVAADDPARAGVVKLGPLQGDPDPDQARVSVTLHENDADDIYGASGVSALSEKWNDEIVEIECGGAVTWKRRFTAKAECLLITGEDLAQARRIAATVRTRIEHTLLNLSFSGVVDEYGEYVSLPISGAAMKGEMVQLGGPSEYDFHIKVRFEVQTTTGVNP